MISYDEKEVRKIVDNTIESTWRKGYNSGFKAGVEMAQEAIKREFKVMVDGGVVEISKEKRND